ncbi:MAG TPA: aminoacyl-tRNA hydrolase [Rhodospirillaceae bacterium]|nr:aminoacyl-tRNA hydrolase [Rhodospirillaceae bacterium]
MAQPTKMIVGLGNPGADYSFNRHNIGFMAVDALAESCSATAWQKKYKGLLATGCLADTTFLLLKPHTYMNLSGESVGEAMRYYKLEAPDVIVIHDDIDLLSGQIKVKQGGGHGGHNGLKSIDAHIGKDYWRVRLGVGHPGSREEVTNHVLGNFAKADKVWLEPLLAALPQALPHLFKGDQGTFIQRLTSP